MFGIKNFWSEKAPLLLSFGAFILFVMLSLKVTHSIPVSMDEGSYLLKGWWYLTGVYRPFQAYGPVTNKMPLAFLVPGLSQLVEPGIRSGRYFSIFQGLIMLIGLWLTARRLSNRWLAALLVWVVVVNQNWLIYYARPFSQITTAMFLTWSLYFLLADERKPWEQTLGALLAGLVLLTRQNMVTYFVFTILYMIWQNGWKKGLTYSTPSLILVFFVHILYWPGIYMMIWRSAAPAFVTSILSKTGLLGDWLHSSGFRPDKPNFKLIAIIQELFGGARYSLVPLLAAIWVGLAFPFRQMVSHPQYKKIVFLIVNFGVLTMLHILAVFKDNTILYSFPAYLTFFNPLALLLIPASYSHLTRKTGRIQTVLAALIVLILSSGIGMHMYREISAPILQLTIPRFRELHFETGTSELWRVVVNKFGWDYFSQERIMPALAGLAFGLLILFISASLWLVFRKSAAASFGSIVMASFMLAAGLLTPTPIIQGPGAAVICASDTIQSFEAASAQLKSVIPSGSLVYWGTEKSPSPAMLLYLPGVRTFPVQINLEFYYRTNMDAETALHNNYWTDELARKWIQQADFALLDDTNATFWTPEMNFHAGKFTQITRTNSTSSCEPKSYLRIYKIKH